MIWRMRLLILVGGGVRVDVLDAWRAFTGACGVWYPVVRDLHRFFIAKARLIANDDGKGEGGKGRRAPLLILWFGVPVPQASGGGLLRRYVTIALLPGPQRLWVGGWQRCPVFTISGDDVGRWPFSVGALVKVSAFLSNLSWPTEVSDLGKWGVSYVCMKGGLGRGSRLRSLSLNIADLGVQFHCHLHLCALMLKNVRNLCQYFGSMTCALRGLPRVLGRFIPGRIGANHVVLRHVGWEKSCHGLTCGPRKSSGEKFLNDLLRLLGVS